MDTATLNGAIIGAIIGFFVSILANKATPLVDRMWASIKASGKTPPPLEAKDVAQVKTTVKTLKKDLERITKFRNSLTDFYLYILREVASGIASLLMAAVLGICAGICYIFVRISPPEYNLLTDEGQVIGGIGVICIVFFAAKSHWKLISAAQTINQVQDYDGYSKRTEANIAKLEQQLNDFYAL